MVQSKSDYLIRQYRSGDEEKIVKLLAEVFEPWPTFDIGCSPVDHWKWKFIDNPANKDTYPVVVAEIDGEIVGVDHGILSYIKIGEGKYLSEKGADSAVSSNHRGKGVYSRISALKHKILEELGFQFHYSLTENPILVSRARRDHDRVFLFPHLPKSLIKINDVDRHFEHVVEEQDSLRRALLKTGARGSKTLSRLTKPTPKLPQLRDIAIRQITRFDERINTFNEKVKPHYNFIVEKTVSHMNWRYCDKRGGDYKVWIAEEGEKIVGYLVLRINKIDPDYPVGYIIDLLALNGRDDVAENLVKLAVDYFDERDLNVVRAQVVRGHPYDRILGKYRLLDTRIKPYVTWRVIKLGDTHERFVKSPSAMLHYTYGNSDTI